MFTRKNNAMWVILLSLFLLAACTAKEPYSADFDDFDGTWVYVKDHLSSPLIKTRSYSWGVGKTIVETTLEIEIDKKEMLIPGMGLFIIQSIQKRTSDSFSLDIKGPGEEGGWELELVFHYTDKNTFWIECSDLEGMFAVGKKKPWYRLSGPND